MNQRVVAIALIVVGLLGEALLGHPALLTAQTTLMATESATPLSAVLVALRPIQASNASQVTELAVWEVSREPLAEIAFSPDGKLLAIGSRTIQLWSVDTGELQTTLYGPASETVPGAETLYTVAFSPNGKLLAAANHDGTIILWDVKTGEVKALWKKKANSVSSVAFSPDGRLVGFVDHDTTPVLSDVDSGQPRVILRGPTFYSDLALSSDGLLVAAPGGDNAIQLWSMKTGKLLFRLEGHTDIIYSLTFSPNGNLLASASGDKTIRLWDVKTGAQSAILQAQVESIAFNPVGDLLASASPDGAVRLWDVKTAAQPVILRTDGTGVDYVAFSPDGRLLASSNADGTVQLWGVK